MLKFRLATIEDMMLYFEWANDAEVRMQSFSSKEIDLANHEKWFIAKLNDEQCTMLIFSNTADENIGQIRIQERDDHNAVIGISIAPAYRGLGYAKEMLKLATAYFFEHKPLFGVNAYIKETNLSSKYAFENAGFKFVDNIDYEGFRSFHYIKKIK